MLYLLPWQSIWRSKRKKERATFKPQQMFRRRSFYISSSFNKSPNETTWKITRFLCILHVFLRFHVSKPSARRIFNIFLPMVVVCCPMLYPCFWLQSKTRFMNYTCQAVKCKQFFGCSLTLYYVSDFFTTKYHISCFLETITMPENLSFLDCPNLKYQRWKSRPVLD